MAKEKFYSAYAKAVSDNGDTHYVTVVGRLEQTKKEEVICEQTEVETKPYSFVDGVLTYSIKRLNKTLTLGMSICHPTDTFDEEVGIRIAKRRIKKGEDIGRLETSDITMLTEDAIMGEILVKLSHITQNIDEYIN